jgi:hypothetical protein
MPLLSWLAARRVHLCCHRGDVFWDARKASKVAWRAFLAKRTEAGFQAWQDHRERTAEKYRHFDRARVGTEMPPGPLHCRSFVFRSEPSRSWSDQCRATAVSRARHGGIPRRRGVVDFRLGKSQRPRNSLRGHQAWDWTTMVRRCGIQLRGTRRADQSRSPGIDHLFRRMVGVAVPRRHRTWHQSDIACRTMNRANSTLRCYEYGSPL